MNRTRYLEDPDVVHFLEWAHPFVRGQHPLVHQWDSPKWGAWSCRTLFGAYETYDWRFNVVLPGRDTEVTGRTYADTVRVLDELSALLRRSVERADSEMFLEAAVAVVYWGRVQKNEVRLRKLGEQALRELVVAARQLDPTGADIGRLDAVRHMNSGFSKIYSLMVDGFPIYDSRVACALASLVRRFCEEEELPSIPAGLAFGIPPSRGSVSRDPSIASLKFPRLRYGDSRRYAVSNLKAAWVIDALSEIGQFGDLGARRQLALQSALFMVGYAPLASHSVLGDT